MKENVLILFVRLPVPGRVKTRLARHIGNVAAARVYQNISEAIIRSVKDNESFDTLFFLDSPEFEADYRDYMHIHKNLRIQAGSDIGERMAHAFQMVFAEGFKRAVLVGTDIPALTGEIVTEAFKSLCDHDTVLGEALDGGYYLIGLNSPQDFLFTTIVWSTGTVFEKTVSLLKTHSLTIAFTPRLRDIDTLKDLEDEGLLHYTRAQ